jgi:hypothetical protein
MGVCGPEELKYPQRLLHTYVLIQRKLIETFNLCNSRRLSIVFLFYFLTFDDFDFRYNIHDGDQFHVDIKPDPPKPQYTTRTGRSETFSIDVLFSLN